ncbi:MAG: Acyl-CoA dehydrogenase, short-chain specific [Firmicutes bacterium]|nr:Acyl-CoA dehydrogenase, short-chain specific [Bacillota bacterium]
MQFQLNEEQIMMQKLVHDFAEKQVAPGAAERDAKEEFSREIADAMGEMGFTGICFPEKYGGAEADVLSYILAVEELSRVDAGVGITLSATVSLCAWPIYAYGTEEQKQRFLVPLAEGTKLGAFGLTEPNAGTDAASQQTVAVAKGDHYILNGSKIFITNAGEAEIYVVFAITDRSKGVKGITAFVMEKGMPGFSFGKKEHKLGIHSSMTNELIFQDVKVPKENMLGKEGEGFKIAMSTLDGGRIGVAAQALGIAQAALEHSIKYSKERVQFGKPIANNQAIAFMLADMATKVDAARLLVYRAAYLKDQGLPYSKEAAMAKMFASDIAMEVTSDAIQIFGGYGYSREYPVERLMRDAKITQIYEGTNQVQRIVVSASVLR